MSNGEARAIELNTRINDSVERNTAGLAKEGTEERNHGAYSLLRCVSALRRGLNFVRAANKAALTMVLLRGERLRLFDASDEINNGSLEHFGLLSGESRMRRVLRKECF